MQSPWKRTTLRRPGVGVVGVTEQVPIAARSLRAQALPQGGRWWVAETTAAILMRKEGAVEDPVLTTPGKV